MLKNHWNTLIICLFDQTTKEPLSKFASWKIWEYKKLWGLGLGPSCYKKKENVLKMVAEKERVHISNTDFFYRPLFSPFLANVATLQLVFFTHFANKSHPPGFLISGTLAWNGLGETVKRNSTHTEIWVTARTFQNICEAVF